MRTVLRLPGVVQLATSMQIRRIVEKTRCQRSGRGFDESNILNLNQIVEILSQRRQGRSSCKIIGSGRSALLAAQEGASPTTAYFTCNFGGLLPLPFEFYTVEVGAFHGPHAALSELQKQVVQSAVDESCTLVIKNIWEKKIHPEYAKEIYPKALLVSDALFPNADILFKLGYYNFLFDRFFFHDVKILFQMYTSVITLIQLAVRSGYREITVYGLDGVGPHFFHTLEYSSSLEIGQTVQAQVNRLDENEKHPVGWSGRLVALEMSRYLRERGIVLEVV